MKRIYILLFIVPLFLIACDKDDDIVIKTSLPITIPVEVNEASAINQKSVQAGYSFTTSETYYLKDNEDVKDYLSNMKYISSKGHSKEITGLEDGDIIKDIEISLTGGDVIMASENITNSDPGTTLPNEGYATFGDILLSEKQITVTVTGSTNKIPMDFNVNVILNIEVIAEEL